MCPFSFWVFISRRIWLGNLFWPQLVAKVLIKDYQTVLKILTLFFPSFFFFFSGIMGFLLNSLSCKRTWSSEYSQCSLVYYFSSLNSLTFYLTPSFSKRVFLLKGISPNLLSICVSSSNGMVRLEMTVFSIDVLILIIQFFNGGGFCCIWWKQRKGTCGRMWCVYCIQQLERYKRVSAEILKKNQLFA